MSGSNGVKGPAALRVSCDRVFRVRQAGMGDTGRVGSPLGIINVATRIITGNPLIANPCWDRTVGARDSKVCGALHSLSRAPGISADVGFGFEAAQQLCMCM